ncbi:MAG: M56 family metallopeptidase [Paludibacter sp.]|nr:M56 family metallopeptidase [Paludibacter sp.]
MNDLLVYFLKVNIAIALFYLFYRLFFSNDTFWRTRRIYLLFSILVSFVYPFLSIENWLQSQEPIQVFVANYTMLQDFTITATPEESSISMATILWGIYAFIGSCFLVRMIIQLISIGRIRMKGERINYHGLSIISLEKGVTPFSFFGDIYLNPALHSDIEIKQILAHELTHVKQLHSMDVMIAEILTVILWINPAVWLLKREIRQNLEYLADNKVIESGFDTKNYQYHLLQLSYQIPDYKLTNKFNISPLKKRITMMNQQKTSKIGILKYLLIAPLALALVVSSNAETIIKSAKEKVLNEVSNQEKKTQQSTVKSTAIDELTVVGYGNNDAPPPPLPVNNQMAPPPPLPVDDVTFTVVENMPAFPGGQSALMKFLSENIKYPVEAQQKAIQGRTICQFIVTKNGSIDSVKVIRSVHTSLDAEAVRVIKAMPDWTPGTQRGEKVNVRYTLPINFRLEGKTKSVTSTENNNQVFQVVETMPVFPGGENEMMKFLSENLRYPVEAQNKGIQGRVFCQFVIDTDGSISDVKVVRSIDENLDAEAVRVINTMPKWTPGEQRGEKVRVKYTLPINFRLNKSTDDKKGNHESFMKSVVFIVNGVQQPTGFDIKSIATETIEKVDVMKAETDEQRAELVNKYGQNAKFGVVNIKLK